MVLQSWRSPLGGPGNATTPNGIGSRLELLQASIFGSTTRMDAVTWVPPEPSIALPQSTNIPDPVPRPFSYASVLP